MNRDATLALIVALCTVSSAGFWWLLCQVIARLSGWRRLAERYGYSSPVDGTRLRFQSAGMRQVLKSNYGGCLTIVVNSEGIGLSILWPFRAGHPPLFIPWSEISIGQEKMLRLISLVRFDFTEVPRVALLITPKLMRKLNEALGRKEFQNVE